jgi:hypothetical protein
MDNDDRRHGAATKNRARPPTGGIGEVEADISVQRAVIGHAPFLPEGFWIAAPGEACAGSLTIPAAAPSFD